jgi:hemerythrin superfamily protein
MTPMQLLKKDHNTVKRLFTEFTRTTARAVKKRRDLIEKIGNELDVHAQIEEELFYPAMTEVDNARALVQHGREEHHEVKELLAEFRELEPSDRDLPARVKEFRQAVLDHASEEEREMFPLAERLGNERLVELAEQLQARKAELIGEAAPGKRTKRAA